MRILTFGDSWGVGAGLQSTEKNFTDFLSEFTDAPKTNFSKSGISLGHILHIYVNNIKKASKEDFVIVIIPPDVRWYTMKTKNSCSTLAIGDKSYNNFIKDKSIYWFKYHHSLFIHSLYTISEYYKLNYIFAHNYGSLKIIEPFQPLIPDNIFLNKKRSLTSLLGSNDYKNYNLKEDGPPAPLVGDNFIPGDTHPNEKGHKVIAQLLLDKFNEKF
jgi:lysophospholipase L1-like esterase